MIDLSNKQKIIIVIIIVVVIFTIGGFLIKNSQNSKEMIEEYNIGEIEETFNMEAIEKPEIEIIKVHVSGEVKNPGVIELEKGERIEDAIKKVGDKTENADLSKINLAYVMSDGEKLYIPKKGEILEKENKTEEYVTKETNNVSSNVGKENKLININTANKEELMKITGIGESGADKIISYRKENGNFKKIEDIKNVSGIGESKFESIKNMITTK